MKEHRINDTHFERLLKEKADEFVMYPSRKVWHSIYNNMHPSRKWPSISMCLVLLVALFLVGYLHTNNSQEVIPTANKTELNTSLAINQVNSNIEVNNTKATLAKTIGNTAQENSQNNQASIATTKKSSLESNTIVTNNQQVFTQKKQSFLRANLSVKNKNDNSITTSITSAVNSNSLVTNQPNTHFSTETNKVENNSIVINKHNTNLQSSDNKNAENITAINENVVAQQSNTLINNNSTNTESFNNNPNNVDNTIETSNQNQASITENKASQSISIASTIANNQLTKNDKSWIENDVFYNRKKNKKWKSKLYLQSYLTSGIVFRNLFDNTSNKVVSNQSNILNLNNGLLNSMANYTPSYGIEAGANLKYALKKNVFLKAGLQFNFGRYSINAFDNHHPSATSITLNDSKTDIPFQVFKSSSISSKTGITAVKLHNTSFQLSIPIGIDYKLAGNQQIKWFVAASVQPTIVLLAKNYLLSTDYKYYIKDNSLLNRFNVNAGFETFLSFTVNGINWQIGPQIRSQLFTTNTSLYNIEERTTSVGLKIGITKKL